MATARPTIVQKVRYYYRQRDLLLNYVRKDLKERYVGSVFGFYWSVINPLILLGIYTFVFSVIFKVKFGAEASIGEAALFIFCGMVPWMAFHETVNRSTNILIDNANLLKKVMFPSKILPVYIVISHMVNLFIGFGILLLAVLLSGGRVNFALLFIPVLVLGQLMMSLGVAWFASAVNVFLRDMAQVIAQFMTIWMYLSPIFYSFDNVPPEFRAVAFFNPVAHLIEGYRDVALRGVLPDFAGLAFFFAFAALVMVGGYAFFQKNRFLFVDIL